MIDINVSLVNHLISKQFPQWTGLTIKPVESSGWDNRTFHLGEEMTVRLPSAAAYKDQVKKEHLWLPKLAPHLPLPIPVPLAMGNPTSDYPWHWSVYRWLPGVNTTKDNINNLSQFAANLANFLIALQRIDTKGGPGSGHHNFFRGGSLAVYDAETHSAIAALNGEIDADAAKEIWEKAIQETWPGPPVWVHGDVAVGNLLLNDKGYLGAVIDFGCSCVGDPACDLVIAWTLFSGESRDIFRAAISFNDATWARGRGWALWKALITLREYIQTDPTKAGESRRVLNEVLSDHAKSAALVAK